MRFLSRLPRPLVVGVIGLLAVAAAVPVTAFVIIPQFVRHTVYEGSPVVTPSSSSSADTTSATPTSRVLARGQLVRVNLNDYGSGSVLLLETGGKRFVRFENVDISAAPAQHVYLSDHSDGKPGKFTDLGPLKATNGSFNYELPNGVEIGLIRSVISYCVQFNVAITYAVMVSA
jgi:hypothetical protein